MVTLYDYSETAGKKGFPLTEEGLYFSIHKWHNKKGVPVEITADLTENIFTKGEWQIQIDYQLINGLTKARLLKLDKDGKPIENELGAGKEMYVEELPENIPDRVRGWLKLKNNEKGDDEFITTPKAKSYPLINHLFMKEGLVPEKNTKAFGFNWDEIEPLLQDFKFNLKIKQIKGGKGTYFVPIVAPYNDGVTETVTGE